MRIIGFVNRKSFFKIGCCILSTVILLVPAASLRTNNGTYGSIISNTSLDYSSIKLSLSSVRERFCQFDDGSKMVYYEDYDSMTIPVNSKGAFHFFHPTDYYSISIDLETLPDGYGANQTYFFCRSNTETPGFEIKLVDHFDVSFSDQIDVTLFSDDNTRLYADYSIQYCSASFAGIDDLKKDTVICTGKLIVNRIQYDFCTSFRYIQGSLFEKLLNLYSFDLISQEQFTASLYDLFVSGELSNSERQYAIEIISNYCSNTGQSQKFSGLFYSNGTDHSRNIASVSGNIGTYYFSILYDTDYNNIDDANRVKNAFIDAYDFFVTSHNFQAPEPLSTQSCYTVTIENELGSKGRTYYGLNLIPNSSYDKKTSTIKIDAGETQLSFSTLRKTVFHEFFHAVMASYGQDKITYQSGGVDYLKWFRESFGFLAGLYGYNLGNSFNIDDTDSYHVNQYLTSYSNSVFANVNESRYYGTVVTFAYQFILKLGGWGTVRGLLNNIQNSSLSDYSYFPPDLVFSAMSVIGYTSNYSAILSGISFNCYRPYTFFVTSLTRPSWNSTVQNTIANNTSYGTQTDQKSKNLQPLSFNYLEYQNNGTPFNAYFTVYASGSGIKLNVIKTDSNGGIHKATISSEITSTINISVQNFGGSDVKVFTIVPVNFNTNGSSTSFFYKLSHN